MPSFGIARRATGAVAASFFVSAACQAVTPLTTFNVGMSAFVENASGTLIYAAVPSQNEVVSINPVTLQIVKTISTGSDPVAISLSLDGSQLYVSNHGNNSVGVVNTSTFTTGTPLLLGSGVTPLAVVPGAGNRLWVLTGSQNSFASVEQINAITGVSTGANLPGTLIYGGDMRGTPDGKTLYYGDYGTSGSYLARYDISGANANTVWTTDPGGNGEDLELSADASRVVLICGGGNNGIANPYGDVIFNTSNGSVAGGMHVGAYPECFAFSPDTLVGYAGEDFNNPDLQEISLTNYTSLGSFEMSSDASKLFVDSTGKYLFADFGSTTAVYSTGRVAVPEPAGAAAISAGLLRLRRRKVRLCTM